MRNLLERRLEILKEASDPGETRDRLLTLWKGGSASDMKKAFEHCLKTDPRTSRKSS